MTTKEYFKMHPNPRKGVPGKKHSNETKLKLSLIGKEYFKSHSSPFKNKQHTKETKLKLSLLNKGNKNPFYGKKHTTEEKEKIRLGNIGRKQSDETKKKIGTIHKGKIITVETKKKMSLAKKEYFKTHIHNRTGKKLSDLTKEKIRVSRSKQSYKYKDSKPERLVQEELIKRNIVFRKHEPIIGLPDIFITPNICIFCDGDLYHAHPDIFKSYDIVPLINMEANKKWEYDNNITKKLKENNYIVLRFWERDIYDDIKKIGTTIENLLNRGVLING